MSVVPFRRRHQVKEAVATWAPHVAAGLALVV